MVGAFNPGAIATDDGVVLLVRVAEAPAEERKGATGLPRWDVVRGTVIDWVPNDQLDAVDPRVVRMKNDGRVRLTFISHLAVIGSRDGRSGFSAPEARFEPASEMEEYGVEDPRIVRLDGRYYITYVTVSRHGAATALASTDDFVNFRRHGIIFPPENKDVVLFPDRVNGDYAAIHRPNPAISFGTPEMWIARSPDLANWGRHELLLTGASEWESARIGGGAPPLRVEGGWLEIYHGSQRAQRPGGVGIYTAGTMLLDPDSPARVLKRSAGPVMVPEADFETGGFVTNVVFPTGAVDAGDSLLVYYGAADTSTAVAEFSKRDLLASVGG